MVRATIWLLLSTAAALCSVAAIGYNEATSDPIVRETEIEVQGLSAPLRLLFLSDAHVQAPDMPASRLARLLRKLDGLNPDLVLLGGDYTGHKWLGSQDVSLPAALAPYRFIHARLGIVAVLGNHDEADAPTIRRIFSKMDVRLLEDDAEQFGPVAVGGVRHRPGQTSRRLLRLPGPRIILSHRPDSIATLPPGLSLMLAGHTHCGQVVLPIVGRLITGSNLPAESTCGQIRFGAKQLIVTAGLGTSRIPLRLGAPPDVWLITLRPARPGDHKRAKG